MAPKATATTITLKHLAAQIADAHTMPKKQADAMLGDMVDLVVGHLKKGDRIRIGGLGIWQVRKRAARMGRNPATGQPIQIKASKKVAFRPSQDLKLAVALPGDPTISHPKPKGVALPGAPLSGDPTIRHPRPKAALPGDPTIPHKKPKPGPKSKDRSE